MPDFYECGACGKVIWVEPGDEDENFPSGMCGDPDVEPGQKVDVSCPLMSRWSLGAGLYTDVAPDDE